jgi:hypothetical protein
MPDSKSRVGQRMRRPSSRGKLVALVEGKAKRRGVRLQQYVGDRDFAFKVGTRAAARPRVYVAADIVPGPAVEGSGLYRCHVIGRQIVAKQIAFIGGAEHRAGAGLDRQAPAGPLAGR